MYIKRPRRARSLKISVQFGTYIRTFGNQWERQSEHLPALEYPENDHDGHAHQDKDDHPCPI